MIWRMLMTWNRIFIDVERGPCMDEIQSRKGPYLSYTTRRPQEPLLPQLPSFEEYQLKAESEANNHNKNHLTNSQSISTLESSLVSPSTYVTELAKSLDAAVPLQASSLNPSASRSSLSSFVALHLMDDTSQTKGNISPTSPERQSPHGVERLQEVIYARDRSKHVFSHQLLSILQALQDDRWNCFCLKYSHFQASRDLKFDMFVMRHRAEAGRQSNIEYAVDQTSWYTAFLALVLKYTSPTTAPPAALLFLADTIRKVINQGHCFQPALLFALVLCLKEEELELESTQVQFVLDLLHQNVMGMKFLRTTAPVGFEEWENFFEGARLPPPLEVLEHRQAEAMGSRGNKQNRMKHLIKTAGMMQHLGLGKGKEE
ncbi:hypothetical protein THRCLA_04705 [Thraustotheca clavata]|uniref:Uncharacterized protein n=1 Tax=Thraustotheca clavata TaxID=74557 RepID=A0A1V9ZY67_9STRA|nr:hypothetical protein THRCLA_04705 [Thraustotheca clavata]